MSDAKAEETPVNRAESKASHLAAEMFLNTLCQELMDIGKDPLEVLSGTHHEHYSLIFTAEGRPLVIKATFDFSTDPAVIQSLLQRAAMEGKL